MTQRKPLTKKTRFEVFKRDSFTCQYCGKAAPDVVLHVDHIKPVVEGGNNGVINLITSCRDCNLGKGPRELSDDTVISKQKAQLDDLNERRQQIEMMFEWHEGLSNIQDEVIQRVAILFCEGTGHELNNTGCDKIKKWIKKYRLPIVLESLSIAIEQYFTRVMRTSDHHTTSECAENALNGIGAIAYCRDQVEKNPIMADYYDIRGILYKRRFYVNSRLAIELIRAAHNNGYSIEWIKKWSNHALNWSTWKDGMENMGDKSARQLHKENQEAMEL